MAKNIAGHLVETFISVLDGNDEGDEKAITAMGILNTLETLLTVFNDEDDDDEEAKKRMQERLVNESERLLMDDIYSGVF